MSLKRFLGWEPRHTTTYTYDDAGRLVRSVSVAEVEWDDEQRAWMQAVVELEGKTCSGCGGFLPDTTSIDMDERYVADHPLRCHRCTAIDVRRQQVSSKPHSVAFTVFPVHERKG